MDADDDIFHLYNSLGDWIGFVFQDSLYDVDGFRIGWVPWDDGHVVDLEGRYMGTIFGERLYALVRRPKRVMHPMAPNRCQYGRVPYPDFVGRTRLPKFAKDLKGLKRKPF